MALSANTTRSCRTRRAKMNGYPVKASTTIYDGAIVCLDSNGQAVPGSDTTGLKVVGVAERGFDNGSGLVGSMTPPAVRYVEVDLGEYSFTAAGSPKAGAIAYVADDDSVTTATGNAVIAGIFTEPDPRAPTTKWYVDMTRKAQ